VSRSIAAKSLQIIAGVALTVSLCFAQQTNVGGVTGTVRDASGAVVPGADVEARNQDTNVTRRSVTNQSGIYTIPLLPIGSYTVTVTSTGFQKSVRPDIPILSGQTFTVDFQLAVGATTQTVTVTAAAPLLDTTTANQGTTRSPREIAQLPIPLLGNAARAAVSVIQNMAGVNFDIGSGQSWMVVSRASINGLVAGTQGYQIDGVDAGMGEGESAEDFGHPTPDMIQEVRLTTNTDTSSGFNGGVSIAMTTKSGTNHVHGDVFYYNRNGAFDARSNFLPGVGKDIQNEYGFAIGGPIVIPHVYNGRNKTFFFGHFNSYHFINNGSLSYASGVSRATVPTVLERQGNFTELLGPQLTNPDGSLATDPLGRPVYLGEIYDPTTTRLAPNGAFVRDPFMYQGQLNLMDPARFSSISKYFINGFKLPTQGGTQLNWVGFPYQAMLFDQRYFVKIDHVISEKHRISFSLQKPNSWGLPASTKGPTGSGRGHTDDWEGNGWLDPSVANGFFTNKSEDRYIFNYVWTVGPNKLFNFRAGMNRVPKRTIETFPNQQALNGSVLAGLKGTLATEAPNVSITGLSGTTSGGGGFGPSYNQDSWNPQKNSITVDMTWVKQNHELKFGSQYIGQFDSFFTADGGQGSFIFSPLETGMPGYPKSGAGYASYLLGLLDSASVTSPLSSRYYTGGIGFFIQDNYRVTHKLTLNYGLRWDYFIPLHVRHDVMSSFDPALANPGAGGRLGALSIYGVGPGRNGLTSAAKSYHNAFAPKLGFAYSITPKTVFRASYGITYLPYWQKWGGDVSAKTPADGFRATRTAASLDNGVTPAFNWDNGFPLSFPQFPIIDPTLDNNGNITYIDRNDNRPEMAQNIGGELARELPGKISLRVGYVGTMVHRLEANYSLNAIPLSALQYGSLLTQSITSPAAQAAGIPLPYPGFKGSVAQALRPYPQYLGVTNKAAQIGNSTYHALQVNIQRQFGSLVFLSNFTLSKCLSNMWFGGATSTAGTDAQHPSQLNNIKALCGGLNGANGDRSKMLNLSWVWNVPVGRGKRYLSGAKGPLNQLVGGWTVSANQNYQSGFPTYVRTEAAIPSLGGDGGIWAIRVPGVPIRTKGCADISIGDPSSLYLNPAAFRDPAPFTLGNTSILPSVRRCGYLNEDFGVQKEFPFHESARVVFTANALNLFNRHYLTNLNTDIDSQSFGRFAGGSMGRSVQMALRIEF
jgi:hypothetical protein